MSFIDEYNELFQGLSSAPSVGELGNQSVEKLLHYVTPINPKVVVEIGFNRGSSSLAFLLANHVSKVYSIDVRSYEEVKNSVEFLKRTFPNRFEYIESSSEHLLQVIPEGMGIDLIFIDGDHSHGAVYRDATLAKLLNPRYVIFDDVCHSYHGDDIKNVISRMGWDEKTIIDCETSTAGREASSGFAIVKVR